MGINQAEQRPKDALVNDLSQLRHDFDDFRSTPQPIGNGSLNYAVFVPFTLGPFTIPAGLKANVGITFMNVSNVFTYDGRPAINRTTLLELLYSVTVDTDDTDHVAPYGGALTPNQRDVDHWPYNDYYQSGLTETNGQRTVYIAIKNIDSSTHTYWIHGTALIPRPALKKE